MTQVHFTLETEDIQSLIDQSVKDNAAKQILQTVSSIETCETKKKFNALVYFKNRYHWPYTQKLKYDKISIINTYFN
ncbi:hypothetical protein ACWOF5_11390 [Carnobacterium divergens]